MFLFARTICTVGDVWNMYTNTGMGTVIHARVESGRLCVSRMQEPAAYPPQEGPRDIATAEPSTGVPRAYRGTSLIRKCLALGPYSRDMPRVLGGS